MEKKANHTAPIVRIGTISPHPNADRLEITHVMDGAYQVVIGKGSFKEGNLAVYIQPDSVVPQTEPFKFIWGEHVGIDGIVPQKRRRVTVKRLRKEWSEGLLMPIDEFPAVLDENGKRQGLGWIGLHEGEDVSDVLGITHYEAEDRAPDMVTHLPRRKYPKTLRGWFFWALYKLGLRGGHIGQGLALEVGFEAPEYDVRSIKNFGRVLQPGERVLVTEKIHGMNWRAVVIDGVQFVGSHYQWKAKGDNEFWKGLTPEIEEYCHQHPGNVVYGELAKTQDGWSYGLDEKEVFPFCVRYPDKSWHWAGNEGLTNTVPIIYSGPYDESLLEGWTSGPSLVPGAKQIREGCVIRAVPERYHPRVGRVQLKSVSKEFLERDSK